MQSDRRARATTDGAVVEFVVFALLFFFSFFFRTHCSVKQIHFSALLRLVPSETSRAPAAPLGVGPGPALA